MATRGNSISKFFVWTLLALLVVGLAGFGATGLSGNIQNVGKVGTQSISVNEYARALQNEIDASSQQFGQRLTFQQAQAFGLDQRVLSRLVMEKALDHEAAEIELSVGDNEVAKRLVDIGAFSNISGEFDRETYRFALENAGLSEEEFEEQIRAEAARTLLQASVLAGIPSNDAYVDAVVSFLLEERSFRVMTLDASHLDTPIAPATEGELTSFYEERIVDYTLPESKRITYTKLTPDMMIDSIDVEDAAVRELYDSRAQDYNRPEKRLVERLPFLDDEAAAAALAEITSGAQTFDAIVETRGLALADIDLGDVSLADLGTAGDAVFAADLGGVVGPLQTDLGPALFRVNAILSAESTPFEDVSRDLRDELALERARRQIESQSMDIDDLLAAGATLEELASETEMTLGTIDYFAGVDGDIAGYAGFQDEAAQLAEGDFPQVMQLEDGGIFAMRLDEIIDPRPQPLAEVRDAVEAQWLEQTTLEALKEQAALITGESFGLAETASQIQTFENMTRGDFLDDLPPAVLAEVFDLSETDTAFIEGIDAVHVVLLDAIEDGQSDTSDAAAIRAQIENQLASSLSQDVFDAYAMQIRQRVGIELDQAALNAVHANFQ